MIECGGGARFLFEAVHALRVFGELRWQQLERHLAPELAVFGQVDFTHPACAEQ